MADIVLRIHIVCVSVTVRDSLEEQKIYDPGKEIVLLDAPLVTVSSLSIREGLAAGKNMNGFLV